MKVSIAMAAFNGANYIKEQLESFSKQKKLPDELVVCDDSSSDQTIEILLQYKSEAPFEVRIFQNDNNLGYVQNFSKAISLCRHDVIFLADQDDIWNSDKIEKVTEVLSSDSDIAYVFSDALLDLNQLGNVETLWDRIGFKGRRYENYSTGNQLMAMLSGANIVYGNTMAFRSSFRDLVLPIKSNGLMVAHDTWISLTLSALGRKGVAIAEPLLLYRQHSNQVVGAGRPNTLYKSFISRFSTQVRLRDGRLCDLRLLRNSMASYPSEMSAPLDQCIAHLDARVSIYKSSIKQALKTIVAEVAMGNYSRFSSSWKSALVDFLYRLGRLQALR